MSTSPCIVALSLGASLLLSACGGGGSASIGGSLNGLGAGLSVVLQDNYGNNLTLSDNGTFTFSASVSSGNDYSVTVLTQPVGQTCTVANASGVVDTISDPITTVSVTCAASSSLGGTVSGLNPGTSVILSNADVTVPVAVNGGFAFPSIMSAGTKYDVTVSQQPDGETCTVGNPSGTISAGQMSSVVVTCVPG
ncbi:MAG: hypothetical protein JOY60_12585 [Burkholderiaceae bacterium]|nr:hypothetical protein [Roseateles sp.]MBV8470681.1 hypothetical protein [Burkholderiaceae bacterium]